MALNLHAANTEGQRSIQFISQITHYII